MRPRWFSRSIAILSVFISLLATQSLHGSSDEFEENDSLGDELIAVDILQEQLSLWEISILREIRELWQGEGSKTLKYTPFSIGRIESAIHKSADALMSDEFRIIELKPRKGTCQLNAWYTTVALDQLQNGIFSIDHFLVHIFAVSQKKLTETLTPAALKEVLLSLGFDEVNTVNAGRLFNLLEAWLHYRILKHLKLAEPSAWLQRPEEATKEIKSPVIDTSTQKVNNKKSNNKKTNNLAKKVFPNNKIKDIPYDYTDLKKISEIMFTQHLRSKTILLAYHDGLPLRSRAFDFKTVKHFFVLKFDTRKHRWVVQSSQEKQPDTHWNLDKLAYYVKTTQPEEGEDYVVVHVGHITNSVSKQIDQPFINAMGLDSIDYNAMFLRLDEENESIAKVIPGELSIFHLNLVQNYRQSYFKNNIPTFREPQDIGEILCSGKHDPYKHCFYEHPISITVHTLHPLLGKYNERPGYSISIYTNGRRFFLRIFADGEDAEKIDIKDSYFLEVSQICDNENYVCPVDVMIYKAASLKDWEEFLKIFPAYFGDLAPRVARFFREYINFSKENLNEWNSYGITFLKNAEPRIKTSVNSYIHYNDPSHRKSYDCSNSSSNSYSTSSTTTCSTTDVCRTTNSTTSTCSMTDTCSTGESISNSEFCCENDFGMGYNDFVDHAPFIPKNYPRPTRVEEWVVRGKIVKMIFGAPIGDLHDFGMGIVPTYVKRVVRKPKAPCKRRYVEQIIFGNFTPSFKEESDSEILDVQERNFTQSDVLTEEQCDMAEYALSLATVRSIEIDEVRRDARIHFIDADGNCMLSALGMGRSQFIAAVVQAYNAGADEELRTWIERMIKADGATDIHHWSRRFNNSGFWLTDLHYDILSRIFNVRILQHVLATPDQVLDGDIQNEIMIPIPGNHVIDQTVLANPQTFYILWRTLLPGASELIHIDRILVEGEQFQQNVLRPVLPLRSNWEDLPPTLTALERDWLHEYLARPYLFLSGHIPARVLALLLTATLISI